MVVTSGDTEGLHAPRVRAGGGVRGKARPGLRDGRAVEQDEPEPGATPLYGSKWRPGHGLLNSHGLLSSLPGGTLPLRTPSLSTRHWLHCVPCSGPSGQP